MDSFTTVTKLSKIAEDAITMNFYKLEERVVDMAKLTIIEH